MDDPNITMEEYIRLEEEKAPKCRKVFNWETTKYGKICSLNNDEIDFRMSFDESDNEDYTVGKKVLLYNSHLKMYPGKLKSKWSGPNIVKTVCPHVAIEITDRDGFSFKVNRQRLKKYYEGDIDKEDDEVSIRRILGNGYGVSTSCTVLGPRERNIDEYWWRIYKSGDLKVLES
ncbi:hypothetical protein Tco_0467523 [Tanacetum coccineum]